MKVYKFEKYNLERMAQKEVYELEEAFSFIVDKLPKQKLTPKKSFNKLDWAEGKNYNYAVLVDGDLTMLIRHYSDHITFWCKFIDKKKKYDKDKFFMFTYTVDRSKLSGNDSDARCDDNFIDIDLSIRSFIKVIKERDAHFLWNSVSCVIPEHCKVKIAFIGQEIYSYDLLIFGCEELDTLQQELFAENEMWQIIKKINVGDMVGNKKVVSVHTELSKHYSDPYYHSLGIKFDGDSSMTDVYSLTRYYFGKIKELLLNNLLN